ncbi:MAG: hypothetical protein RI897_4121 [Verrucomicrobiota bacterium]
MEASQEGVGGFSVELGDPIGFDIAPDDGTDGGQFDEAGEGVGLGGYFESFVEEPEVQLELLGTGDGGVIGLELLDLWGDA